MKFDNIASAYGFYKALDVRTIESRAQAIRTDIAGNKDADIQAYQIELEGIENALAEKRAEKKPEARAEVRFTATERADGGVVSSKEYRSAFFKQLMGRELSGAEKSAMDAARAELRADGYNTTSNSGAVLPTATLNEVISKARKQGGIMEACRAFAMPTGISVPVATPKAKASWHVEGAEVAREQADVAPVTFDGFEIIKILSISAKVQRMSVPAFEAYLTEELSASVMAALADALVNGTGEGQGTGILPGVTWAEGENLVTASGAVAYADIIKAIAMLKRGYGNGAQFAMSNGTLYSDVYGLCDENKRPLFVADPTEAGKGRILGFPVIVDDYMPDGNIVFGNFQYMGYNLPGGIQVERSTESGFRSGLVDFRALAVADCKPLVAEAFTRIRKGA